MVGKYHMASGLCLIPENKQDLFRLLLLAKRRKRFDSFKYSLVLLVSQSLVKRLLADKGERDRGRGTAAPSPSQLNKK